MSTETATVKGRCPECRRPFTYPRNRGAAQRRYCSAACRDAARAGRKREARIAASPRGRRWPLPQQAVSAGWQLRKAVERVERVCADDRLAANGRVLSGILYGHLRYAADACARMAGQLRDWE
jgi:hypothetical protein